MLSLDMQCLACCLRKEMLMGIVSLNAINKHLSTVNAYRCRISIHHFHRTPIVYSHLCVDLLLEDILKGDGVCCKFANTLRELVYSHGVLVEVEAEVRLVCEVALLLNVHI